MVSEVISKVYTSNCSILEAGRINWTQFWKRTDHQRSIPSNFGSVVQLQKRWNKCEQFTTKTDEDGGPKVMTFCNSWAKNLNINVNQIMCQKCNIFFVEPLYDIYMWISNLYIHIWDNKILILLSTIVSKIVESYSITLHNYVILN